MKRQDIIQVEEKRKQKNKGQRREDKIRGQANREPKMCRKEELIRVLKVTSQSELSALLSLNHVSVNELMSAKQS